MNGFILRDINLFSGRHLFLVVALGFDAGTQTIVKFSKESWPEIHIVLSRAVVDAAISPKRVDSPHLQHVDLSIYSGKFQTRLTNKQRDGPTCSMCRVEI